MFLVIFNVTLINLHIVRKTVVKYKGLVSTLLACVYVFSVLISVYFHTHSNNFSSTELSYKTNSNSAKASAGADNCYTLHTSQVLIGDVHQICDFKISKPVLLREYSFVQYFSYSKTVIRFFSLRAPPIFI